MDLVREDGILVKPYLFKIKDVKLVSEDDTAYVVDGYINYCCYHHGIEPIIAKGIRYPKYAWKLVPG